MWSGVIQPASTGSRGWRPGRRWSLGRPRGQFLWPLLTVSDPAVRPLPLELSVFSGQQPIDWGSVFAFGVLLVAPILAVFFAFQRYFVQSVAGSAVKG
jgi:multiple sugar transport system permease protein